MGQKKILASAAIIVLALMMAFPSVGLLAGESSTDTMDLSTTENSVLEAYGKLPLLFIENQGQVGEAVRHYVTALGQTVYFTEENIVFDLVSSDGAKAKDTADLEEISLVQYNLSINSTEGGSVTTPGEATFNYTAGTVVELVATPDAGYKFVNWTGDVGTIADANAAATNVTMSGNYSITANFAGVEAGDVGIKAGDWIKLQYTFIGWPAGQSYPEWLKFEFLSLNGTLANVRFTQRISDGTEQSNNATIDVVSGIEFPPLAGIVISANLTIGESVYIAGYGNVTIESEATKTYAGGNRTVLCTNFAQDETQVTYCWDKLTGVMVEVYSTSPSFTATARATETNMWESAEAATARMPWWPWIIVGVVAVGLVIFFMRRRGAA